MSCMGLYRALTIRNLINKDPLSTEGAGYHFAVLSLGVLCRIVDYRDVSANARTLRKDLVYFDLRRGIDVRCCVDDSQTKMLLTMWGCFGEAFGDMSERLLGKLLGHFGEVARWDSGSVIDRFRKVFASEQNRTRNDKKE